MNAVHFILQSKGGCGKTFISSLLTQFFVETGADVKGWDTDQENRDLFAYKGLPVRYVDVMASNTRIDQKKFDGFMESLIVEEGIHVVDNGANSFTPLLGYLVENDGLTMLKESGKNVFLHSIIGGGDNLDSTSIGFSDILNNSSSPIILWLNEHFGELSTKDGTPFVETDKFKEQKARLRGAVMLHRRNPQTFGEDLRKMTKARLTLTEVMASAHYSLMEKQRLRVFGKDVFEQLAGINFS
jgi:hypothetical protein